MSHTNHHSDPMPPMQEVDLNDARWNDVVSTRLPATLEAQARQLKAWSRQRGLRCVSDLLRAFLVYACCQYSYRELGMWAVLKGVGSLSERAWRKRLDRSRPWIAWLLSELLGVHQTPEWLPKGVGRVLLIDATRFKVPAGTGDDVRLHQSYDLRAGRMEQVQVTDRHQAESLSHFEFRAGDLVVTDAGYPVGSSVELTQQRQCVLLQRTAASQLHLEDEQGQTINVKERIKHVAANSLKEVVGLVNLPESGKRARVRVLCYRLPKEQASKARERKAAKLRKKHGPNYNRELVWWAGWVMLVSTTNPAEWSGKELVALYRARWQIELFFKRLKQCLRLHQLQLKEWVRVSCVVQLNLIGWWLQEEEAQWMREILTSTLVPLVDDLAAVSESAEGAREPEAGAGILSSWTLAHFCCEQVRTMVRGAWSHRRIQECQQALQRYVRSRQRKRGHRETEQRVMVQRRSPSPAEAGGA
jgi:GNAT superfamily N-acetyltransferase